MHEINKRLDELEKKEDSRHNLPKDCPYCRGPAFTVELGIETFVRCGVCTMCGPSCIGRHEAIIKWNNMNIILD